MELLAFELTPDIALEELQGATMSFGPRAETFDVKAALETGNGVIVTDNALLASTLRGNPILQPCDVPAGAEPVVAPGADAEPETQPPLYEPQEPGSLVEGAHSLAAPSVADEPVPAALVAPAGSAPEGGEKESEEDTTDDEEKDW